MSNFDNIFYTIRKLFRSPGFTLIAIVTLGLGIGANSAIFSIVDAVLIRPLPFPDSERLVSLWHEAPGVNFDKVEQTQGTYSVYRKYNQSFTDIAVYDHVEANLTGSGEPLKVHGMEVSPSFFPVLQIQPSLGRAFSEAEGQPGSPPVVILSHDLWRQRFSSDTGILGKNVLMDGQARQVIGVMPRGFTFFRQETALWIPLVISPERLGQVNFYIDAVARLKPGVSVKSAESDLVRILPLLPEEYGGGMTANLLEQSRLKPFIVTLRDEMVGNVERVLWILMGTVFLVLLIACANVANLFLVRTESRYREVAVRTALGATRSHLSRLFLTESTAIAFLGGLLGLGLAELAIRLVPALSPLALPRIEEVGLSYRVFIFAGLLSVFTSALFGIVPVLRYGRGIVTALNEAGRGGSTGRQSHRIRSVLVAGQVALAVVLLVGSVLLLRSFLQLRNVAPGFEPEGVVTMRLSLPSITYSSGEAAADFYQRLLENIRALPGVTAAGGITSVPLTSTGNNNALLVEDFPLQEGQLPPIIRTRFATAQYFETMRVPVIEGRVLERRDHEERSPSALVSKTLATRFWPNQSALGRRISPSLPSEPHIWYTIVGVVGDVHDTALDQPPDAMVYFPLVAPAAERNQWSIGNLELVIRSSGPATRIVEPTRKKIWQLDPNLPISRVRLLTEIVSDSIASTTFAVVLLGLAASVALLLGTIGLYGALSYVVSQRTREIGVRMALGAARRDVIRMVLLQALRICAVGVVVGATLSLALTRSLESLLYGTSAADPSTYLAVALLLLLVAGIAGYFPARRAASIPPTDALRVE